MTIFRRIIEREIPADIVFEDETCLALRDVKPQAPVHLLIIPKKEIASIDAISDDDGEIIAHLWQVIRDVARRLQLNEAGYRVVVNCGRDAGQTVDHLHFHLLGGRPLGWPPG